MCPIDKEEITSEGVGGGRWDVLSPSPYPYLYTNHCYMAGIVIVTTGPAARPVYCSDYNAQLLLDCQP